MPRYVENSKHATLIPPGCDPPSIWPSIIPLRHACSPKPDGATAHCRWAVPCGILLPSAARSVWFWGGKKRLDRFSMCPSRPPPKQKWICTFGFPISDKWGGPALTDPVYSQLFTSSYVSSDRSQLITAVKLHAQHARHHAFWPSNRNPEERHGGEEGRSDISGQ